jgi:hypothetical protein
MQLLKFDATFRRRGHGSGPRKKHEIIEAKNGADASVKATRLLNTAPYKGMVLVSISRQA